MRWLIMLFLGMALGAGALFTYLRWYGDDASPGTGAVTAAPAAPPAPPAPLPAAQVSANAQGAPIEGENAAAALAPAESLQPADGAAANPAATTTENATANPAAQNAATTMPSANLATAAANTDPHLPTGQTGSTSPSTKLLVPVEGVKLAHLNDTFNQPRGQERRHEALDIMAPKGTKVLAVADGKVAKLHNSQPGGLTVYQFDPDEKFSYYYAHLDRYAPNLKEGQTIKRGELIGYVGVTGNSDPNAPHLHFAVFELPSTKEWWKGKPINPFPLLDQTAQAGQKDEKPAPKSKKS